MTHNLLLVHLRFYSKCQKLFLTNIVEKTKKYENQRNERKISLHDFENFQGFVVDQFVKKTNTSKKHAKSIKST